MIEITSGYLASQGLSETFPKRFWERVFITPTHWLWEGHRKPPSMHGTIWRGVRNPRTQRWQWLVYAHVASWLLNKGPIPEGQHVLHCCPGKHISWCVNPDHLYLGSEDENKEDMAEQRAKGLLIQRTENILKGEDNPASKLTGEQVDAIRAAYATGKWSQPDIAKIYNITQACVWQIVNRRSWRNR